MASFYGNMKNNSRASFIFDRVYPSRVAMEEMLNRKNDEGKSIGDGIFINRYVLVDYHYALMDDVDSQDNIDEYYIEVEKGVVNPQNVSAHYTKSTDSNGKSVYTRATTYTENSSTKYYQRKVFIDRFRPDMQISNEEIQAETSELLENDLYYAHRYTDWEKYRADYDCTVWMKIYADNKERYIMVAELDAKAPILEFIDDAPSCIDGTGHFDVRISTDLNYVYFIPRNWDMVLNKYNPNDPVSRSETDNTYWYYQDDKDPNDLWYEDYIYTTDTVAQQGKSYYTINFRQLEYPDEIKVGQSIKNMHCYIPKYVVKSGLQPSDNVSSYYEYINGKYVRTTDTNAQGKTYYELIIGQYMAADEDTALAGVNYYIIDSVQRVSGVQVGTTNVTGKYELNIQKKTFNSQVEYPYFNTAGFDPKVSTHVSEKGQGVFIKKVPSTQQYPVHKFVHAGILTKNTWLPNRYYTYSGNKVEYTASTFNRDHAYYIGPSTIDQNSAFILTPLIVNDEGQYQLAAAPGSNQKIYYDQDLNNLDNFKKATSWQNNTAYYEITTALNSDGTKKYAREDDTYRVDIYLPELGNTVADIYDVIYGAPKVQEDKNDGYNNLIGYCSQEQWESYNLIGYTTSDQKDSFTKYNDGRDIFGCAVNDKFALTDQQEATIREQTEKVYDIIGYCSTEQLDSYTQSDNGAFKSILKSRFDLTTAQQEELSPTKNEETGQVYPVYRVSSTYDVPVFLLDGNGAYWSANKIFDLSQDEYNALSPEIYPGLYDIPVYAATGSNIRPYNEDKLKSTLAPPYDNLEGEDDISIGWSLTLLKRYISELRELAHGSGEDGHGIGLQSDWTLDDEEAFGYIYHRPNIIVNYTPTNDQQARPNKSYFKEYVEDGEVKYESLSNHYERIVKKHYVNATDSPLYLSYPLSYKIEREIYKQIDNNNASTALASNTISKPIEVETDAAGYVNYYIQDENDPTIYKKSQSYNYREHYYSFISLTIDDYNSRNWRHQREVTGYHEIVSAPPSGYTGDYYVLLPANHEYEGTIYVDEYNNEYRDFLTTDLIGYYCDFDNDPNTPHELITASNCENVGDKQVYSYAAATGFTTFQYAGFYYSQLEYVYDQMTNANYNANEPMWVETSSGSGTYRQVTAQDYVGWYYQDYDISYVLLSEDNYASGQKMYKNTGTANNPVYSEFTYADLCDSDYYIYIANQVRYALITTGETNTQNSTINYTEIPAGTDIYVYIHGDNSIDVGDSLNQGFVVFELPKTLSNGLTENKTEYKQCNMYTIYNSETKYYIQDTSGQYVEASYPIVHQSAIPIRSNYIDEGLVRWDHGYQMTVNENNIITQRVYSSCEAGTNQNEASLYYNIDNNGVQTGKSVYQFSIVITNDNDTSTHAPDISNEIEELNTHLSRQDTLDRLNSGVIEVSFVDKYDVTYVIDSFHTNWPDYLMEETFNGFYYARLRTQIEEVPLQEQYFLEEPTRYYTLEQVPVEQDDYEIHNIWNRVLNRVLLEP